MFKSCFDILFKECCELSVLVCISIGMWMIILLFNILNVYSEFNPLYVC